MAGPTSLAPHFRSALESFHASNRTFAVLRRIPTTYSTPISPSPSSLQPRYQPGGESPSSTPAPPPSNLLVLDSSFNPPTRAHLQLARSALSSTPSKHGSPKFLLLLLSTTNADKAPKPAAFPERLAMMTLFAEDLLEELRISPSPSPLGKAETDKDKSDQEPSRNEGSEVIVDVGVTTKPYFIDKTTAIDESGVYSLAPKPEPGQDQQPPQTHLLGYDVLLRLLDTKYYAPSHSLSVLAPLFARHYLRITYREGDKWGSKASQDDFVASLRSGDAGLEGWRPEWAEKIEMVEGANAEGGEGVLSSTAARKAAEDGEDGRGELERICTRRVREFVVREGLYVDRSKDSMN